MKTDSGQEALSYLVGFLRSFSGMKYVSIENLFCGLSSMDLFWSHFSTTADGHRYLFLSHVQSSEKVPDELCAEKQYAHAESVAQTLQVTAYLAMAG